MKHNKKQCTFNCKDSNRDNKEKLKFQVFIQVLAKENYFCFSLVFGTQASKQGMPNFRMSVCTSMVMFSVISYSCSVCSYYTCSHCGRIPCRDSEYLKTFHLSLNREWNELQMGLGWKVWTKVEKIMCLWWFRIICLFCMEVLVWFFLKQKFFTEVWLHCPSVFFLSLC